MENLSPWRESPHEDVPFGIPGASAEALRPLVHEELRLDLTRQRLHSGNQNIDPYAIDDIAAKYAPTRGDPRRGNVQNEIDFNWKRYETYGKPDYSEQRAYHAQGWRPVMHHHFPGRFAPEGTQGPVIVKDMILMERPMTLTLKARNEEIDQASLAMRVNREKVRDTPDGSAPRIVYADRTSREAIEIPD
jgi:hypothetical protein